MRDNQLNIVFSFNELEDGIGQYAILYAYHDDGLVSFFSEEQNKFFNSKEELVERIQDFLDSNSFEEATILAVNDLNIGLESSLNIENFESMYEKYGSSVQPREGSSKKSIFSKIF